MFIIGALILLIALPNQTKNKLHGTWGYHGKNYDGITFKMDDEFYECGMSNDEGHYKIDGKNITLTYSDGRVSVWRLADDGCLYSSNGSRYEKISEQEAIRQNGLSDFEKMYIKSRFRLLNNK